MKAWTFIRNIEYPFDNSQGDTCKLYRSSPYASHRFYFEHHHEHPILVRVFCPFFDVVEDSVLFRVHFRLTYLVAHSLNLG